MVRKLFAVTALPTKMFVLGGTTVNGTSNVVEAFDAATQSWSTLRGMPTARTGLVAGVIGDYLYAAGGFMMNVVEKYKISTDEWSTAPPMHNARTAPCLAVLDGKLFVIGGGDSSHSTYLASVEVFTPTANAWSAVAAMPVGRKSCGAVTVGGLIYVFGGDNESGVLNSVVVYNATSDSWQTLEAKMRVARGSFGIVVSKL